MYTHSTSFKMSDFNAHFEAAKRKRKKNLSQEELTVLADKVNEPSTRRYFLKKISDKLTNEKKEKYWRQRVLKIYAVSLVERSVDEIRKKRTNCCLITKTKAPKINAEMAKTGSGTSNIVALTPLEDKIASILGRTVIEAIKGGIDGKTERLIILILSIMKDLPLLFVCGRCRTDAQKEKTSMKIGYSTHRRK